MNSSSWQHTKEHSTKLKSTLTHWLKGVQRNQKSLVAGSTNLMNFCFISYEVNLKHHKQKKIMKNIYPIDNSLVTVFPMQVAPPSTRAETIGDVREAASCVLAQSGWPKPVTCPSISNLVITIYKSSNLGTN